MLLPMLLQMLWERNPTTYLSLINNWDALKISLDYIDFAGCFLPENKEYEAFPNAQRFIRAPCEHGKTHTIKTVPKK